MADINSRSYNGYGLKLNTGTFEWSWTLEPAWSLEFHIGICLLYSLSVHGLQKFMSTMSDDEKESLRSKWGMDRWKWWHNVALSLVSLLMGVTMIHEVYLDGRFTNWHTMSCQNTPNSGAYGRANWVYLISKIWEWMDTFWLVLYGKEVIALHYFHHMTTFTMAAFTHNFPVGGYAFINCIVHFVMYMHYAKPVRWARPFITTFQLVQFICVISIHTYGYLSAPGDCFNFSRVQKEWWYCQLVVVGYFLLFVKFFHDNYMNKGRAKAQRRKIE
jgi:hypothetical protein